jgi:UDP-2,4-diacetamido-2,4,6-trideoxy-beta-L-altropyranose hydrolase
MMRGGEARLFCDAGPGVGLGHMARCIALAEAFEADGLRPVFVTSAAGREVLGWMAPGRFQADARVTGGGGFEIAVFDDYALGAGQIEALGQDARMTVAFDDIGDREGACDITVNAGGSAAGDGVSRLYGPAYAPLRAVFRSLRFSILRDRAGRSPDAGSVLVTAGGVDGRGFAPAFLRAVLQAPGLGDRAIDVALGGHAVSWPEVAAVAETAGDRVRLHRDAPDVVGLYAAADCSVGPGGVALLEKLCLGLASIAVVVADNQRANVEGLTAQGCIVEVEARADANVEAAVHTEVGRLLRDDTARSVTGSRGAAAVDGLGARRIALSARPERDKAGTSVTLRPFTLDDAELLLSWQREPGMRSFFRDTAVPSEARHHAWCAARVSDPFATSEIILADGRPVGLVRFDPVDDSAGEVSILMTATQRGKGTGSAALRALRRILHDCAMWAEIHPDNAASWSSFLQAGFLAAGHDRVEAEALAGTPNE